MAVIGADADGLGSNHDDAPARRASSSAQRRDRQPDSPSDPRSERDRARDGRDDARPNKSSVPLHQTGSDRRAARWSGIDSDLRSRRLRAAGPARADAIEEARALFGRLPDAYRDYASRYGSLRAGSGEWDDARYLLGLTNDPATDARQTARILRALYELPDNWLPIELLPDRQVTCVDATSPNGAVSLIDLEDLAAGPVPTAPTLLDFVYEWRADLSAIAATVDHLRYQREQVEAGRRPADKLDRPGDWTVARMCSQDVVLAVLRTRHNREINRYDVSVFATATLSSFAPGATVRAALTAVLSDAYRSGGPLAVAFGGDGNGLIPGPLRRWAAARGITLPHRGGWDAATGEALYLLAADLTPGTRDMLPLTSVSTAAVCHAVASDAWAPEAVEAILRWSPAPQRILTGSVPVTDRLNWIIDRQTIRAALVVAAAARVLRRGASTSDDDDSGLGVTSNFDVLTVPGADPSTGLVRFTADDGRPLQLPWRPLTGEPAAPAASIGMHVLAVENHLLPQQVEQVVRSMEPGRLLIVPADANTTTERRIAAALTTASEHGVTVLAAPDYTSTLDASGERAVLRARTARS